jgi:hypothetical protein
LHQSSGGESQLVFLFAYSAAAGLLFMAKLDYRQPSD